MAFERPTLQDLITRIDGDLAARLTGGASVLRRSVIGVLSRVLAGASYLLHGHLDWVARQVMIDTAEAEHLDRHASIWGISRLAAAPAIGNVTFTGTNGVTIPTGTLLQRTDQEEYETTADAVIAAGAATAPVTAVTAGANGNADAGTQISLVTSIAGVNAIVTVAVGGLTGGTEPEADDDLRLRLLARVQQPPHGGADFDYIAWAKEVAGVTRAWAYSGELGLGTVTVRFVRDGDASIIPDAAEVAAVQSYIDARRPITAVVTVVAPIAVALDFGIAVAPNTQAVKDAVQAELEDLLRREAEPGGTILLSHIREAISIAAGETNYTMTTPAADVAHTTGQMAVMGVITWA